MSIRNRQVLYLNIPSFPLEVESALGPQLRHRPVALAPPNSDRAKLWAVSDEARKQGLRKGMALAYAKRVCRDLIVLPPRPDLYQRVHAKLENKVKTSVELFESERPGKIYLDFTGLTRLYGSAEDFASQFQKEVKENFNLTSSWGAASNKMVSKVAAKTVTLEREIFSIEKGKEKYFLSPKPHEVLPLSKIIKKKTQAGHESFAGDIFEELNIHTVEDLNQLGPLYLEVAFGEFAQRLYHMAQGIDEGPINPPQQKTSLYRELHLVEEQNDPSLLTPLSLKLLEELIEDLRSRRQSASELTLTIRYSDYKFFQSSYKFSHPCHYLGEMEQTLISLWTKVFTRRTNLIYLQVALGQIEERSIQLSLFSEHNQKSRLEETISNIRQRFGPKGLIRK